MLVELLVRLFRLGTLCKLHSMPKRLTKDLKATNNPIRRFHMLFDFVGAQPWDLRCENRGKNPDHIRHWWHEPPALHDERRQGQSAAYSHRAKPEAARKASLPCSATFRPA